jgi:hypothetical protein
VRRCAGGNLLGRLGVSHSWRALHGVGVGTYSRRSGGRRLDRSPLRLGCGGPSDPERGAENGRSRGTDSTAYSSPGGPPGKGKTESETAAAIIYHAVKQNRFQVLACAPANVTVDALAAKLLKCGLRVFRFEALSYTPPLSRSLEMSFHWHASKALDEEPAAEYAALVALKATRGELLLRDDD